MLTILLILACSSQTPPDPVEILALKNRVETLEALLTQLEDGDRELEKDASGFGFVTPAPTEGDEGSAAGDGQPGDGSVDQGGEGDPEAEGGPDTDTDTPAADDALDAEGEPVDDDTVEDEPVEDGVPTTEEDAGPGPAGEEPAP